MTIVLVATLAAWLLAVWMAAGAFTTRGLLGKMRRLAIAAVWTFLGTLLAGVLVLAHLFHVFAGETLVARVVTVRRSPLAFELMYTPVGAAPQGAAAKRGAEAARHIQLRGDQWAISGGIVKWHPWLTAFGLPSYQRPMRLSGQFSDIAQQRAHLPTVYALEPRADRFWELLYRLDPSLPFVEAVYGSSAYVSVEPNVVQEIYVTPSGYLIKRKRSQ